MASSSPSFPSSSSISSTNQWKYDVFLSFRGEDTRNTATDFLNYALEQRGIYTFKDDKKLEKGKTIKLELLNAIEESRFAVVILSENYASSTWCLEELAKIIDCKKEKRITVLPIFYNVNPSDLRKLKGAFAKAFDEHEKQFKEKVGAWRDALNHVAGIGGYHVKNSPFSEAVISIVSLVLHKSSFEFSEVTKGLVGIHSQLVVLESYLALWLNDEVRFIGIWAMGGMGKSTLASVVYRMVSQEFEACCFIDDVRKKDVLSLQKDLIFQIFQETNLIKNKYDGVHMIKKMLGHKKILLVLDDVDESNDLKMLIKKSDWFGSGSRIIITTRDKHLLEEFPVDEIFEVKALNYEDALCLFCSKAFKKKQCPDEYSELSESFLEYVHGLPLALEVLGSFLFGRSIAEWKNALEMLKEYPQKEINQVLKISFDGLLDSVKDIFKDIACLFNHEEKDHVVQMLNSLGRYSHIGLSILIDKSLLKISKNNKLWMHDLLRDMGRDIVRQESRDEPGKRSRLWLDEDIDHVLKNNTGTEAIQAINTWDKDTSIHPEEIDHIEMAALLYGFTSSKKQKVSLWDPNAFLKMPKLKFLRIHNVRPQVVPEYLPNKLTYLEWSNYPSKLLPCFLPNELVQLRLQHSEIELLWEGMKNFDKLKLIDMVGSSNLIITPDFNGVPNLEELVLAGCSNLCKLHPSIGKMKKLKLLDLENCQELTSLPDKFEMESLVILNLTCCSKVKKIPEFVGNMKLLQELHLRCTTTTTLPSYIECLTPYIDCFTGLEFSNLWDCKQLVCTCSLTLLSYLRFAGCSKFDKLPEELGNIVNLNLLLGGTATKELPSSIEFLICLTPLDLINCKDFLRLPSTACSSLHSTYLFECSEFVNWPENLGNLKGVIDFSQKGTTIKMLGNLKGLIDFSQKGTTIKLLPSFVGRLTAFWRLNLSDRKKLSYLPISGCSLKMLISFSKNQGNLKYLPDLSFKVITTKMLVLPSSIRHWTALCSCIGLWTALRSCIGPWTALRHLNLSDCKKLACLPDIIGCLFSLSELHLCGHNFVSLPKSISQLSRLRELNLDGCKRLRSLPDIPSQLHYINVNNCTSLERFPESPRNCPRWSRYFDFCVSCLNCFNIQIGNNILKRLSGLSRKLVGKFPSILPGKEIPNGFENANIRVASSSFLRCDYSVNIQSPWSGFDELWGILLCVVFVPCEHYNHSQNWIEIKSIKVGGFNRHLGSKKWRPTGSKYGKLKSHHLWLPYLTVLDLETPGWGSIDEKEFHEVEITIATCSVEVETVGFRLLNKQGIKYSDDGT